LISETPSEELRTDDNCIIVVLFSDWERCTGIIGFNYQEEHSEDVKEVIRAHN
jgi:hypothetical protein